MFSTSRRAAGLCLAAVAVLGTGCDTSATEAKCHPEHHHHPPAYR